MARWSIVWAPVIQDDRAEAPEDACCISRRFGQQSYGRVPVSAAQCLPDRLDSMTAGPYPAAATNPDVVQLQEPDQRHPE